MNRLKRGLTHGAIYAVVFCTIILAVTPVFNTLLYVALLACIAGSFVFGIFTNLRARDITCVRCGRTFRATTPGTGCPDCGWSQKSGTST